VAAALVAASLVAVSARAGVIHGTVSLRKLSVAAGKGAAATAEPEKGISDVVVYVEKLPPRVEQNLTHTGFLFFRRTVRPRIVRMVQMDRRYRPHVIAVPAGSQVAIQNLDRVYHSTFSVSLAKKFDLGKHAPGRCDTITFDRPGVVNLHCDIHPEMEAFVVVTPNHAFASADSLGRYHLPALPAGTYAVHVFHPRRGEIIRTAEVPKRGDLELNLRF
jgi:plastocyanin